MANLLPATSTKGYGFDAINSTVAIQTGEKYDMWLFGGEVVGLDITEGKDVVALENLDMSPSNPRTFSLCGLEDGSATLVAMSAQVNPVWADASGSGLNRSSRESPGTRSDGRDAVGHPRS